MIVYVESNFLLELALLQEEHESCEAIVALAEAARLQLAIPAYCFVEPYEVLRRRHIERIRIAQSAREQLKLLRRSKTFSDSAPDFRSVEALFRKGTYFEEQRFDELRVRLLSIAEILPLTSEVLRDSANARLEFDLSGQDSVVYASVAAHLHSDSPDRACFINRNSKDFDNPSVVEALKRRGCKLVSRFSAGHGYIESRLEV